MKSLITLSILLLFFAKTQAQVIVDTSRCGITRQGHLKSLIDDFKNNCLDKGRRYNYRDVAFSGKETINLLNRVLETRIFNKYCFLERCSSEMTLSKGDPGISWGMAEIGFKSKKDYEKAITIIKSRHSDVFTLKVFTIFALLKEQDTIVIFFTEFYSNDVLKCFFNRLKTMKGQYVRVE